MTKDTLLLSPMFQREKELLRDASGPGANTEGLPGLLMIDDMAAPLFEAIFSTGLPNACNFISTSSHIWATMRKGAVCNPIPPDDQGVDMFAQKIWNFTSGRLESEARSSVFVAVSPEYSVGEIVRARDQDPLGTSSWNGVAT